MVWVAFLKVRCVEIVFKMHMSTVQARLNYAGLKLCLLSKGSEQEDKIIMEPPVHSVKQL